MNLHTFYLFLLSTISITSAQSQQDISKNDTALHQIQPDTSAPLRSEIASAVQHEKATSAVSHKFCGL